jgi:hypothetical protein
MYKNFSELKKNITRHSQNSTLKKIKIALLGDTATQFLLMKALSLKFLKQILDRFLVRFLIRLQNIMSLMLILPLFLNPPISY